MTAKNTIEPPIYARPHPFSSRILNIYGSNKDEKVVIAVYSLDRKTVTFCQGVFGQVYNLPIPVLNEICSIVSNLDTYEEDQTPTTTTRGQKRHASLSN